MELTCLNCLGTFEVDMKPGSTQVHYLRCPLCGTEQTFIPQDAARLKRPLVPPPRAQKTTTAFRKPMQAFLTEPPRSTTPPQSRETRASSVEIGPFRSGAPTPPEAFRPPVEAAPQEPEVWLVRSPTGLVLEFPASETLVNWSAVVDNPTPYQVSRGGQEWISLAEFLRLVRQGNRSTAAFRAATRAPDPSSLGEPVVPHPVGATSPQGKQAAPLLQNDGAVKHPTSQFQIKLKQQRASRWRLWLLVALCLVLVATGALVAAYVFRLL